jgi:hypothetical protein
MKDRYFSVWWIEGNVIQLSESRTFSRQRYFAMKNGDQISSEFSRNRKKS